MKIKAYAARYDMTKGENPALLIDGRVAEDWFGRDPFEGVRAEGVSDNLMMAPEGTTDGHNLMYDSTFIHSLRVDKNVPISPLFVKDLAGRTIYIGYGPERKANMEWAAYAVNMATTAPEDLNPFIPFVTFPRFCRDASEMEGEDLLEQVFLTKFRCLEMSMGYNGQLSGADEDEPLVAATYLGVNLYPYKLRLDTFYIDGFRLPQTQMLYARGMQDGVSPVQARKLGQRFLQQWAEREIGVGYEEWLEKLGGESRLDDLFLSGCSVIPTFEACNGLCVVGSGFQIEEYWPGRAVIGLHDIVEKRADKSPLGTILEVREPGFVTADYVHTAKVVISDGSGYVSPNSADPDPLLPNLNLPHTRTVDVWRATWVPTHPLHFESPAIWGWDDVTGRFLQLSGPLWDPLHYYYESVDRVLDAFNSCPLGQSRKWLVPVPEDMQERFFPVVPMKGFDTFSVAEYNRRAEACVLPQSCLKRIEREDYSAGLGYHPLPAEFEFELDPFWFPELHPLNRVKDAPPEEIVYRIAPVISPQINITTFKPTIDVPGLATWFSDEDKLMTPMSDPLIDYPQLTRYLMPNIEPDMLVQLCPVPYLSQPEDESILRKPAALWWVDENGNELDSPTALQDFIPDVHDALWDIRQQGVEIVKLRHMIYRANLPLYMTAWWFGWSLQQLELAMEDWIMKTEEESNEIQLVVNSA
jgi:hypothetical protein